MNQPKWLGLNQVLFIHQKVIDYTGGSRLVRDQRLLESAINRPKNLYAYQEDCDLFDLAAMYAEGIGRDHALVDGNKRTAVVSMEVFLRKNGLTMDVKNEAEQERLIEDISQGRVGYKELAEYLRNNTQFLARNTHHAALAGNKDEGNKNGPIRQLSRRHRAPVLTL